MSLKNSIFAGSKFWKTGKIIKAINEEDYQKLESKRNGHKQQTSSKITRPLNLTVEISSSDSDDSTSLRPLARFRKRAEQQAEPSNLLTELSVVHNKCNDMESLLVSIKDDVQQLMPPVPKRQKNELQEMFICIICKANPMEQDPVIPQCCCGFVVCKGCIEEWLLGNPSCPQCREEISLDLCLPIPPFRPLAAAMVAMDS